MRTIGGSGRPYRRLVTRRLCASGVFRDWGILTGEYRSEMEMKCIKSSDVCRKRVGEKRFLFRSVFLI